MPYFAKKGIPPFSDRRNSDLEVFPEIFSPVDLSFPLRKIEQLLLVESIVVGEIRVVVLQSSTPLDTLFQLLFKLDELRMILDDVLFTITSMKIRATDLFQLLKHSHRFLFGIEYLSAGRLNEQQLGFVQGVLRRERERLRQ